MIRTKIQSLMPQLFFLNKRTQELVEPQSKKIITKNDIDTLLDQNSTDQKPVQPKIKTFNFFNSDLNQLYLPLSDNQKSNSNNK